MSGGAGRGVAVRARPRFWAAAAAAGLALLFMAAGCQTPGPAEGVSPADPAQLARFTDDGDAASLTGALTQSLNWARTQPPTRVMHLGTRTFTAGALATALARWQASLPPNGTPADLLRTLPEFFDMYTSAAPGGTVLVTGYYVPEIEGRLARTAEYRVPVYPVPDNLVTVALADFGVDGKPRKLRGRIDGHRLVPFWDRAQIRAGALEGSTPPPLAWVQDELGLAIIEIQGSGVVRLPTGEELVIGYADENGQPYRPIGKVLLNEKKLTPERISMHAIRAYLGDHPDELGHVLAYNPSFVFFHLTGGPIVGSLGEPLTPGRSLATDQKLIPPGIPLFLAAPRPKLAADGRVVADGEITRLAFNQDTGGAIRGPGHVDYFWGKGEAAAAMAGMMRQQGVLFVFVPKP